MSELVLSADEMVLELFADGQTLELSAPAQELVLGPVLAQSTGVTYSEQSSDDAEVIVDAATVYLRLTAGGIQLIWLPLVSDVPDGWVMDIKDCGYNAEALPKSVTPSVDDLIADVTADDGSISIDQNGGSIRLRAVRAISTWERVG